MIRKKIVLFLVLTVFCFINTAQAETEFNDAIQKVMTMNADQTGMATFHGGEGTMGNNTGEKDEMPEHQVNLEPFFLDFREVSNAEYNEYLASATPPLPAHDSGENLNSPEQAVVKVNWYDAEAYCRSKGKRLPTEAEFEFALRVLGKQVNNNSNPFINRDDYAKLFNFFGKKDKFAYTAPTTEFANSSANGVVNLLGNVWEWTADWYAPYEQKEKATRGQYKVLRGGSWVNTPSKNYQTFRSYNKPHSKTEFYGFRCALDAPQ